MAKLIEVSPETFLVSSAIEAFTIEEVRGMFRVIAHPIGTPDGSRYVLAECETKQGARKTIDHLWSDIKKASKAVTIKAKIEEE